MPTARNVSTLADDSIAHTRILVVDDHEDTARAIQRLLCREGYDVRVATGFADALTHAAGLPSIDVLISDITLPDGNGYDLLPLLRERQAGGVATAIALTGHAEEEWLDKCRAAGFELFLHKPVELDKLLSTVRAAHTTSGEA